MSETPDGKNPKYNRRDDLPWWWGLYTVYEPGLLRRLLCWFGIYLCGALPLSLLLLNPAGLAIFPVGLGLIFNSIMPRSPGDGPGDPGISLAYGFYLAHFVFSLIVPTRRTFRFMMILLMIVVVLNLVTCASVLSSVGRS